MIAIADPAEVSGWYPAALVDEVETAINLISTGIDRLIDIGNRGDFMALGPQPLIGLIRTFEEQRNRLPAVDHLVVEAVREEKLWEHTCSRSASGVLQDVARLSPGEAGARVRAADRLGRRSSTVADILPPLLPALAAAQRTGAVTEEQVRVIGAALQGMEKVPGVHPARLAQAEQLLVEHAAAFRPKELRQIGDRILAVIDPDGTLPRDVMSGARRELRFGDVRSDGTCGISGSLTPTVRAKLFTVLSRYSAPAPADADGRDPRTPEQREHDALETACDLLLRSGDLPPTGGIPTTLIVTVSAETLAEAARAVAAEPEARPRRHAVARTADGQTLSLDELLHLAEQADVIPTYLNETGGVIGHGRARRVASPSQIRALIARDGGCSFPGCTAPPQWCERHHVVSWLLGGETDVDNLTLVCGWHHREFRQRGWDCTMIGGLPHWIPPRWIDPDRTPVVNPHRIPI